MTHDCQRGSGRRSNRTRGPVAGTGLATAILLDTEDFAMRAGSNGRIGLLSRLLAGASYLGFASTTCVATLPVLIRSI